MHTIHEINYRKPVADPGGAVWTNLPPHGYSAPLKWRPSDKNPPPLVPIEVEKKANILSLN